MIQKRTGTVSSQLNQQGAQRILSQKINGIMNTKNARLFSPVIQSAIAMYETYHKKPMDGMRKAILANSIDALVMRMIRSGKYTAQMIQSAAVDNIWDIDSPITMLFNLLSIIIPNFAFMEVCGVQPMPTKQSPIIFPQLTANEDRNGVLKGSRLLGADGWEQSNQYTSNKVINRIAPIAATAGGNTGTVNAGTGMPNAKGTSTPVAIRAVDITVVASDGVGSAVYQGVNVPSSGTSTIATGVAATDGTYDVTIDNTGVVTLTYTGTPGTATVAGKVVGWYDLNQVDPAQVIFEWQSKELVAEPRRIRSTYDLDNFYAATKTLAGQNFDLDKVLATTMAGYINKEISCDIFDNILEQAAEAYQWDTTPPTDTDWYWHQASVLGPITDCSTKIRKDVARSSGNIIIADSKLMATFEKIGGAIGGATVPNPGLWQPQQYSSEPIGPYVAGVFSGKYKVIKNQDFPEGRSVMLFKKDDLDAAYYVGVFLGLYATEPLGLDTLNVVQGLGCQMGEISAFPSAIKELSIVST